MGELVDDLIRHEILERIPDPADRRARPHPTDGPGSGRTAARRHAVGPDPTQLRAELGITVDQVLAALDVLIRVCGDRGGTR